MFPAVLYPLHAERRGRHVTGVFCNFKSGNSPNIKIMFYMFACKVYNYLLEVMSDNDELFQIMITLYKYKVWISQVTGLMMDYR